MTQTETLATMREGGSEKVNNRKWKEKKKREERKGDLTRASCALEQKHQRK